MYGKYYSRRETPEKLAESQNPVGFKITNKFTKSASW